jgi:hypothetical protein
LVDSLVLIDPIQAAGGTLVAVQNGSASRSMLAGSCRGACSRSADYALVRIRLTRTRHAHAIARGVHLELSLRPASGELSCR